MGAGFPSHRRFYGPRPITCAGLADWAVGAAAAAGAGGATAGQLVQWYCRRPVSALVARRVAAVQRKRQLVSEGAGEAGFARQCWLGANGTGSKSSGGKQYMYLLTSTECRKENAVVRATVDSASGMHHRTQHPVRHLAERMDSD